MGIENLNITTVDGKGAFTKEVTARYKEMIPVPSFGRSFFPEEAHGSLLISIQVQRGSEFVAVDVVRGSMGNRNKFSLTTEKIIKPPYFREYFEMTEMDHYSLELSPQAFLDFASDVGMKISELTDKIDRAYERFCWQVLEDGIVLLNEGINIDYGRLPESVGVLPLAEAWDQPNSDPFNTMEDGGTFLRTIGKVGSEDMLVILGQNAIRAFLKNEAVTTRNDLRRFRLDETIIPRRNSSGGVPRYQASAGAYNVEIWSYPEFYEVDDGLGNITNVPYLDPDTMIMIPPNPTFKMAYGAVPQLTSAGQVPVRGKFKFDDYIDHRKTTHEFDVKSAGVPIPVAVNTIYTRKVTNIA